MKMPLDRQKHSTPVTPVAAKMTGEFVEWRTDVDVPEPPFWGVREVAVDLNEVYPYLDRHVLFKLHWGGRGRKGEDWRRIVEGHDGDEGFAPKLERMWDEQDYLHPRARLGYFPCNSDGNELVIFDPEDPDRERDGTHA